MLSNITIGQYFPLNSPLHRADPRIKLLLTIEMIVAVFVSDHPFTVALCASIVLVGAAISKVPLKMYLKMLKSVWPVILLTAVLNVFYVSGRTLWSWWIFNITYEGIERSVYITVRIILLIVVSSMLTYTTSPTELTDAIERLLSPLRFIGLGNAVHTMAMMTSIALRFIPTLIEEADKIMSAQKARGSNMEEGGLMQRVRALLPILIPLLISASRRAYDLAEAMECRCYHGGKGRTKMKQLHMHSRDLVISLVCVAVLAAAIAGRVIL
jgi:energy-coupling factor transport system permease protein